MTTQHTRALHERYLALTGLDIGTYPQRWISSSCNQSLRAMVEIQGVNNVLITHNK